MLGIIDQIFINKYAQDLIDIETFKIFFSNLDVIAKRNYLEEIAHLILQSKPYDNDIEMAIINSGLRPSFTPCVLLRKGIAFFNLKKIIALPENELDKVLLLFLSLFKISYQRRFKQEKNRSDKWWYWDLSDKYNVELILNGIR